jgi:hypothetical protein
MKFLPALVLQRLCRVAASLAFNQSPGFLQPLPICDWEGSRPTMTVHNKR